MDTVRSPVLQATVSCFRAFFPAAAAKEAECSLGGQGDGGRWRGNVDGGLRGGGVKVTVEGCCHPRLE